MHTERVEELSGSCKPGVRFSYLFYLRCGVLVKFGLFYIFINKYLKTLNRFFPRSNAAAELIPIFLESINTIQLLLTETLYLIPYYFRCRM